MAVMLENLKRTDRDNRKRQDWYGRTLARLVDAERFPALAELIAAGTFDASGKDVEGAADFDFGLARMLDGVERLVRSRPTPAAPSGGRILRG
jgi:tetracycline repressor-like protein